MDNHANHNKTWSDADIRMYLNGELSPREMHDLERAALDDPFLADALEGLVGLTPADTGLYDLRSRLAARVEKKEQRPVVAWFRRPALWAAAVVIGLAGIGLTAYYTLFDRHQPRENTGVVKTVVTPDQPSLGVTAPSAPANLPRPAPAATDSAVAKADKKADTSVTASSLYYAKEAKRDAAKKRYPRDDRSIEIAKVAEKPGSPDSTIVLQDAASASLAATPPPPPAAQARAYRALPQQDRKAFLQALPDSLRQYDLRKQQSLVFSGRVVDNNNRPLAGASVFLNNAPKTMTRTDALGNFDFRVRPRDTTQQMAVTLVGYKQTLVSLNTNALTNNVIHLEEAKANLGEVVVTGFGATRKETYATAPSDAGNERLDTAWLKAAPIIGKLAYQQYLDTARRSLKLDSTIFGTERISFQVDQKGQITEFKIEHSLSPAHDAGLIQLITTGPAWRVLRGRKVRALVSLSFP